MTAAARSARIRDAASLMLVRDWAAEPRVLLGKRASSNRFMPGMYVFPGGALAPEDFQTRASGARDWPYAGAMGVRGNRAKAVALALAAIRETAEETGLMLGKPVDGAAGLRPCLGSMIYLGRAVTPAAMPIRFNARFFMAPYAEARGRQADSDELSDLRWIKPQQWRSLPLADITACLLRRFEEIRRRADHRQSFVFRYSNDRPRLEWRQRAAARGIV